VLAFKLSQVPRRDLFLAWCETLRGMANLSRPDFLSFLTRLAAPMVALGGSWPPLGHLLNCPDYLRDDSRTLRSPIADIGARLLVVAGLTPPDWEVTLIDENLGPSRLRTSAQT